MLLRVLSVILRQGSVLRFSRISFSGEKSGAGALFLFLRGTLFPYFGQQRMQGFVQPVTFALSVGPPVG
ncbi:hypothetical protein Amal_03733 [Acetobacter malorum]|uniref:Uncharacterized protein n=1 Tax=Acetobacter malorum TaxID=178901 RepID=A0A177G779_9PROT|nr:hypothetical protein Amal_03733 [Acetobacter malorum]